MRASSWQNKENSTSINMGRESLCIPVDRNGEQLNVPILQPEPPMEDQMFYMNGEVFSILYVDIFDPDSNPPTFKVYLDTEKL